MNDNFDYKADLKKRLPELKKIEGFPIGDDEDILALSIPPFYTVCPNPYINEYIEKYGKPYYEDKDDYYREPYVGDVSEGKNHPIYLAHGYATKVPHKAIERYILHYTNERDLIFDGFSGTGMTGVAARFLNRKAILSDLSTVASFISSNYNSPKDVIKIYEESQILLKEFLNELSWLYDTIHKGQKALINYTVWSDVFECPYCNHEVIFFNQAYDSETKSIRTNFNCDKCNATLTKNNCKRIKVKYYDSALNKEINISKQVPILINYTFQKRNYEKIPDENDLELIERIEKENISYVFPLYELPEGHNLNQPKNSHGLTHFHHFYTKRNLWALSKLYDLVNKCEVETVKSALLFTIEQASQGMSKVARYVPTHYSQVNQSLPGTLYIGSQIVEVSPMYILKGKISRLTKAFSEISKSKSFNIVSTQSATDLPNIKENSIDYIFTDPPFGDNLMYSELNIFTESWLTLSTNNQKEAIINSKQNKGNEEYKALMISSFKEFYRLLKPKRWITIEFNSSKSLIWNIIQEAITKSGFVIAQVSVLDKKQKSYKQTTSSGSVKSDLVISAYKPSINFERRFLKNSGEGLETDFVHEFLYQQPCRPIIERTEKMLYSKMLSYYIQHGYEVRYDAKTFYQMLRKNFTEENGYWFNATQINSYLEFRKKMKLEGIDDVKHGDILMFVMDEKSALVWLHNFMNKPKSFSDIHTAFTQLANIQGDEVPDLKDLLEQNFITENGLYRRPRTEPEHNQIIDKREKQLIRQFESLLIQAQTEKKKIKSIRKEAVLLGFENCYKEKRFQDILNLAKKLDNTILEENAELKEFVDAAEIMVSGVK